MAGPPRPIDPEWVKRYVDQLLEAAQKLPDGSFRDAILHRADAILDLVQAWKQKCEHS